MAMREYDHHVPDCDIGQWPEEAQCLADIRRRLVTEEKLLNSVE